MKTSVKVKANTFGQWGYVALDKHFNKMLKHEAGVLKDKDPEELHQMRVGSRRLRSAIAGFAPSVSLSKGLDDKTIGKIARILGSLRDLDVLADVLENKYKPVLGKAEQKLLDKALKQLSDRRGDAFEAVKKLLEDGIYPEFKEKFALWLVKPEYQEIGSFPIAYVLPDLLLPEGSKFLVHPAWLLNVKLKAGEIAYTELVVKENVQEWLSKKGETLHDLRKEAKRVRYLMELFTQFYGESYGEYLEQVKAIQDVLGNIQDAHVLGEYLEEVLDEKVEKVAPDLTQHLNDTCYESLQKWEDFQRKFLNLEYREGFRLALQTPKG